MQDTIPAFSITSTLECNMKCSYCILTPKKERQTFENIKQDLEDVISFFSNAGHDVVEVQFGGLEPLLYPEFILEVMKFLPKEYVFKFTTNGTLPKGLKALEPFYDRILLSISCDGVPDLQLKSRGRLLDDTFIDEARKLKGFGFNFAICPENSNRIFESYQYLKSFKPQSVSFTIVYNSDQWTPENRENLRQDFLKVFKSESEDAPMLGFANMFRFNDKGKWERSDVDGLIHCDRLFAIGIDKLISRCSLDYSYGGYGTTASDLKDMGYEEFLNKLSICQAPICDSCYLKNLCTNKCPMSLVEKFSHPVNPDAPVDDSVNVGIKKIDIDSNGLYVPCFVTTVMKECLETYGELLMWNSFGRGNSADVIRGFLKK